MLVVEEQEEVGIKIVWGIVGQSNADLINANV